MLVEAIVGHMVGDYLLQDDQMPRRKKTDSVVCAFHCAVWTLCVCVAVAFGTPMGHCPPAVWLQMVAWLFCTHFAIDRWRFVAWWMKTTGQSDFRLPPTGPWSIIVVDNVWHLVTLWLMTSTYGVWWA